MQAGNGLLLGWRYKGQQGRQVVDWTAPVYDSGDGHLITVAPTRSGKGVSYLVPSLLSWQGSAVVIDVKGELTAITARRRREMKQKVFVVDPFGVTDAKDTASLNPLDLLEPGNARFGADARLLARMIGGDYANVKDPFWNERAETLIAGVIQHLTTTSESLPCCVDVAEAVERRENMSASLRGFFKKEDGDENEEEPMAVQMLRSEYRASRAAGNIFLKNESRVLTSIVSVAAAAMSFVDDGRLGEALGHSTVSLDDLAAGKPTTVYLVIPPDMLGSHGRLLRLWLSVIIAKIARRRGFSGPPTMLFIDEAAQLGHMEQVLTAVTLMGGYGLRTWSVWQDLSQLQQVYPVEWETLLNNSATQLWFGFNTPRMAADAAAAMGAFSKAELVKMDRRDAVLLQAGCVPEIIRRPNYLEHKGFSGLYDQNPYVVSPHLFGESSDLPENVIGFGELARGKQCDLQCWGQ